MKYIEIIKEDNHSFKTNLKDILSAIKEYAASYVWSLQLIEAVGDIEKVIGMNMLALEEKCSESKNGLIMQFEDLFNIAIACDYIIEILLVGCKLKSRIPKAYKEIDWESQCDIIISKEDSTIWQLYSVQNNIMQVFKLLAEKDDRSK